MLCWPALRITKSPWACGPLVQANKALIKVFCTLNLTVKIAFNHEAIAAGWDVIKVISI